MDARPSRPRGFGNALQENLATMFSDSNAGLRGPAKRAAFGDVTNVSKILNSGRENGKPAKMATTANTLPSVTNAPAALAARQPHTFVNLNKENAPYMTKDSSRPAQRHVALVNKTRPLADIRQDLARKSMTTATQDSSAQFFKFDFDIPQEPQPQPQPQQPQQPQQQHARVNAVSHKKIAVFQGSADAPPLQPRHAKSQPQLKTQPPTLRRTQSKTEGTDLPPSKSSNGRSAPSGMPADCNDPSEEYAYLQSFCMPLNTTARQGVSQGEDYVEFNAKLPDIREEPAGDASYRGGPGPIFALSEPEECWDDDEDDDDVDDDDEEYGHDDEGYEDNDHTYITGHSTKTRDLTMGSITTILAPRAGPRVQRELEDAKMEVERTRMADDIEEEAWDVSMVAEYGDEIFAYLRQLEVKLSPNPHYMNLQTEIQWSMRSVLMDWVVQVHNRFNLLPETLYLTVNYIDRFLSCKVVSIGKLQLVGATAILVASKYEEINCPSLDEIVYMVDGGYTTEEVLKAERFMLTMLGFELGWPGPMSFLRRVSKADDYDLDTRTLAKYFMELTIMDERFVASPPSFVAAGAHCLSRLILNKGEWTKHHVHYSGYTWGQLRSLITMMIECCIKPRQHHGAIFDKYKEKRFKEASVTVQRALDAGFTLPQHSSPVRRLTPLLTHFDDMPDPSRAAILVSA